ncbi:FapA family protein [Chungangia koreensis]|uniref:FapA family protein n=1 Tax=Chungangia koreensis TaxID=752657 RepID=A0ABV8X5G1_9LACT
MIIEENDFFSLIVEEDSVFLTVYKPYPIKKFDSTIKKHPRIKLTNFMELKKALEKADESPVPIGIHLPIIEIEIDKEAMSATAVINEEQKEILLKQDYFKEELRAMAIELGIVYGLKEPELTTVRAGKPFIIAEGSPAVKGKDSEITYIERPERKPVIREDDTADYYEMNFIFEVKSGDWLGEKTRPLPGVSGKNLYGETLRAETGDDLPFSYDSKIAFEIEESGKLILRATKSGALEYINGILTIRDHLIIEGDVGVETGNVQFDGSISVRGTIMPGYSIVASSDLEVRAAEGVVNASLIKSTEGSIYIRGGIFGRGITVVEAEESIYVKHANECLLKAGEEVNIGFYALGSTLLAKNILVDERKGKLIGGRAEALFKITASISGNQHERRTELIVKGIDKDNLLADLQVKAHELKSVQQNIDKVSEKVETLELMLESLSDDQKHLYETAKEQLSRLDEQFMDLDREIQAALNLIKYAQNEEIRITKEAHPNTLIQIGSINKLLSKSTVGTFRVEDGVLNV